MCVPFQTVLTCAPSIVTITPVLLVIVILNSTALLKLRPLTGLIISTIDVLLIIL